MKSPSVLTLAWRSFWVLFGGIWLVVGVGLLSSGVATARHEYEYRSAGESAGAVVLAKDIRRATKDQGTSYEITYRFNTSDGRPVQRRESVSIATWEPLREGDTIAVEYLRRDPSVNRLADGGDLATPVSFIVMGGVFGGVGGFLFIKGVRWVLRERRLRRDGTLTDATVTAVAPTKISLNRQQQWAVYYQYRDHGGREQEGRSGYLAPDEAQSWNRGDIGKVRFDRERPGESIWLGHELT